MRLIDADELKPTHTFRLDKYTGYWPCLTMLDIKNAPTIDAAPVVHGRWEFKRTFGFENIYVCTVCGRVVRDSKDDAQMKEHYPYCHCGARMDLEEANQ